MGYNEIPGGLVLTGGTMSMPGAADLAQQLFQSNIRIAIPDYIGVRDPQYTAGIGILKFAYKNAKIQGKAFSSSVSEQVEVSQPVEQRQQEQVKTRQPKEKEKKREKGT